MELRCYTLLAVQILAFSDIFVNGDNLQNLQLSKEIKVVDWNLITALGPNEDRFLNKLFSKLLNLREYSIGTNEKSNDIYKFPFIVFVYHKPKTTVRYKYVKEIEEITHDQLKRSAIKSKCKLIMNKKNMFAKKYKSPDVKACLDFFNTWKGQNVLNLIEVDQEVLDTIFPSQKKKTTKEGICKQADQHYKHNINIDFNAALEKVKKKTILVEKKPKQVESCFNFFQSSFGYFIYEQVLESIIKATSDTAPPVDIYGRSILDFCKSDQNTL